MAELKGTHLKQQLGLRNRDEAFGIAYSILNWSGVFKGLSWHPSSLAKVIGKGIEDGHATAFMIGRGQITLTGMSDDGWVFNSGPLKTTSWARTTPNANTDVYYLVQGGLYDTFERVRGELETAPVSYAMLMPNTPLTPRYENCISSTHYIVYRMGLGYWVSTKGSWIPSFSNYMTWMATKASAWHHRPFPNTNTHIP